MRASDRAGCSIMNRGVSSRDVRCTDASRDVRAFVRAVTIFWVIIRGAISDSIRAARTRTCAVADTRSAATSPTCGALLERSWPMPK